MEVSSSSGDESGNNSGNDNTQHTDRTREEADEATQRVAV